MKRLILHYLAPHNLTPTDPASITSMAYGKMFPLRPIQLFNLGQEGGCAGRAERGSAQDRCPIARPDLRKLLRTDRSRLRMGAREDQIMQVEPATARCHAGVELPGGPLCAASAGIDSEGQISKILILKNLIIL